MTGIRRTASYVRKWGENTAVVAKVALQMAGVSACCVRFLRSRNNKMLAPIGREAHIRAGAIRPPSAGGRSPCTKEGRPSIFDVLALLNFVDVQRAR